MPRHFILLYDFILPHSPKHDKTVESHETGVDLVHFSLALSTSPIFYMFIPLSPDRASKQISMKGSNVACRYYFLFLDVCLQYLLVCVLRMRNAFFLCLLLGFSRTLDRKRHSNGREAVLYLLFDLLYRY